MIKSEREIFLVSAYCDTDEKIELLTNIINFLHDGGKKICLCSHITVPDYIIKKIDYFVYDKENETLEDPSTKFFATFKSEFVSIQTKLLGGWKNTTLPVLKSLFNGINIARGNGYNILHYIEYDTELKDFSMFDDNLKILSKTNAGCVYYGKENNRLIGSYIGFNLDRFPADSFVFNRDRILNEWMPLHGSCENIVFNEYAIKYDSVSKDTADLFSDPFKINLSGVHNNYEKNRWGLVLEYESDFYFFIFNDRKDPVIFNVIIDSVNRSITLDPGVSFIDKLPSTARFVKIFCNNLIHRDYDLEDPLHIGEIRKYNTLEFIKT